MAIYYVIYGAIGLYAAFLSTLGVRNNRRRKAVCAFAFLILALMFGLRHPYMGVDLGYGTGTGYLASFKRIAGFSWKEAFQKDWLNYEQGYILLNKFMAIVSSNEQYFLGCCAVISLLPVMYVISKESSMPVFSIYLYMGLPAFLMLYSGMRQAIAMGLCSLAMMFINQRRPKAFILTVALASTVHYSAFIFGMAYPLYHLRMNSQVRIATIFIIPVVYVFRSKLFSILSKLFKENAVPDNNGAFMLAAVFALVYVFCVIYTDHSKEENGLMNIYLVACCAQAMGGVYQTILRVGYYFMFSLVLLLPMMIHRQNERNARILMICIGTCFVLFGLSSIEGSTWPRANPYYWFWESLPF